MRFRLLLLVVSVLAAYAAGLLALPASGANQPFLEQGGQVVMEAENFRTNVTRGGKSWTATTALAGYAGSGAMVAGPNTNTAIDTGYATTSPELTFDVTFSATGTYYVWLRGHAAGVPDNSVHVGLDGQPTTTADRMSLGTFNAWTWFKATSDGPVATLSVPSAGVHTVNVWMREDGISLDRLLLTTSSTFTPSGAGPPESPLDTGSPPPPPPPPGSGPTGSWTSKAPIPSGRAEVGVATLGGKVYVIGGQNDSTGRMSTVSVYDPASDTWSSAAPLPGPPRDHLGAAAVGGKIYAIGGLTDFPGPSVADVYAYDPATNTWTAKASLPSARGAMGIAVISGKIYAAGGLTGGSHVSALTVYNPANDALGWQTLAAMPTARHHLTAEAIGGALHTIGGRNGTVSGHLPSHEVYDVVSNTWSGAAPLPTARSGLGSAVLNGRIYAFGGEVSAEASGVFTVNEEYDPSTNSWRTVAPMITGRHGTDGAVVNGTIYAPAGGTSFGTHNGTANEAFILDLAGSWSSMPSMPDQRREGGVTVLDGKLYVITGNQGSETRTKTALRYDPVANSWSYIAPLPAPNGLDHMAAVSLNGLVYAIGGLEVNPAPAVATTFTYDPATNTWARKADLPVARGAIGGAVVKGKIHIIGGTVGGVRVNDHTVYDPGTDSWSTKAPMPTVRDHVAAVGIGGRLYALGGFVGAYPGGVTGKVEVYDPDTNTWDETAKPMPTPRADIGVAVVNGRILLYGGINGNGAQSVHEEYDPVTDTWRTLAPMPTGRRATVGAAASNGVVYAPGGSATLNDPSLSTFETFTFGTGGSATAPNTLAASPSNLDFGTVVVGSNGTRAVQLTNLGGSGDPSIVVDATTIGGTDAGQFGDNFNDAANVTLAPGASTTITATFAPTTIGAKSASLSITHSGSNTPLAVPLAGSGASPGGSGSIVYRVNAGGGVVASTPAWSADSSASPSPYVNAAATGNTTASNGATIDMSDSSLPAGTPAAIFADERYDAAATPEMQWDFPLTAGSHEVRLYFAETFGGAQTVGARKFDVTVEGQLLLNDYDIFADVGANKGVMKAFQVTSDANLDIDFGHVVENPAIKAIEILSLGGGGGGTPPPLGAAPTSLAFGGVAVNSFQESTVELTNLGASGSPSITIDATSIGGTNANQFSDNFNDAANATLAPGQSTLVNVTFRPTATGSKSATLSITHNGSNTPLAVPLSGTGGGSSTIAFGKSLLSGETSNSVTSLQFGPDNRLYVAEQQGYIKAYTINRGAANSYSVTATETINHIRLIPNRNDDGALNPAVTDRQVTGILVAGTASNPIIYVTSSDPRIGGDAGSGVGDTNLDTNSGTVSKLTWNGTSWQKLDLVRGLPRSEENHAVNGLQLSGNTLYVAIGGHTNMGAPSNNFAFLPEFALSAAILQIDLAAIGSTTYDLPTLDDDSRPGTADSNDPFGGNNGKNQAKLVPGGPVQIFSPGYRNPYDVLAHSNGQFYTIDNGGNAGWGGVPVNEGPAGNCTNAVNEPGGTDQDSFHLVKLGKYGGHPNPTRGNMANTFNNPPQSPVSSANPVECDYRSLGHERGNITAYPASTNGLAEYTATNFGGVMTGDILAASFDNTLYRVKLNSNGSSLKLGEALFSTVGNIPLDVTAVGNTGKFPGTIWVGDISDGGIRVFEPNDFSGGGGGTCTGANDPTLDEDGDGFKNADEIANGTNPCSAADFPPDWDGDKVSNLTDPDDDNDGQLDTFDPFAIDASNGTTTQLPRRLTFDNDGSNPGGLLGLGFTGLMTNGTANYESLYSATNMTAGGAAGVTTVDNVPEGNALGATNTQAYGFQFGVATPTTGAYTAHTRIQIPFAGLTPQDNQSMGLFIGTGTQDNYVKIVVSANGGAGGVQFVKEVGGIVTNRPQASVAMPGPSFVDLYLTVDPVAGTVQPSYSVTSGGTTGSRVNLGVPEPIPTGWVSGPAALAVGIISTSAGPGPEFPATWDFVEIDAVDTTAPTVTATGPADGATAVVASTNVTATFSEAMDASSVSSTTFTLVKLGGPTTPVAAVVAYNAVTKTATLDPAANLEAGASYTATVEGGAAGVKDPAGNALAADKVWSFTVAATPPSTTFQEQSGQVVMEGESYLTNVSRGGKTWTLETSPTGYGGSGLMSALPNSDSVFNSPYATTAAELSYQVQFATTGTYHVWLRGLADTLGDNSVHVGLDAAETASADKMSLPTLGSWTWFKSTTDGPVATISVTSAGVHTIHVWVREDGVRLDRLLLTTNSTFTPTGVGPAESPRV